MRWRDRLTEAINLAAGAPPLKLDVAVPLDAFATTLECAHAAALADGARLIAFGHLAEGNLHLNVLGASDTEQLSDAVLTFVAAHGGTISAEHGIGVAKARWLHLVRSVPDLAAQRRLKAALDPNAILNPGVLDPWTRGAREATQVPTSVRTQVP
jgi:FAD/FMN-containing dehydrogenase